MKEQTKDVGFAKIYQKIKSLGAKDIRENKEGNKRIIIVTSQNGSEYFISTRAKTRGTWQTSVDYGLACQEKYDEREFWVFIDLDEGPDFYIAPLWWIRNDINKHHELYLEKHGGRRAFNDYSKHHAIEKRRILQWRNQWQLIGL